MSTMTDPFKTGLNSDYLGVDISSDQFEVYSTEEKSEKQENLLDKADARRNANIGSERIIPVSYGFIRLDRYNKVRYHGQFENSEEDIEYGQLDEHVLEQISSDNTSVDIEVATLMRTQTNPLKIRPSQKHKQDCEELGKCSDINVTGDMIVNSSNLETSVDYNLNSEGEPVGKFDHENPINDFIDSQYFDASECSVSNTSSSASVASDSLQHHTAHESPGNFIDESYFGNISNSGGIQQVHDSEFSVTTKNNVKFQASIAEDGVNPSHNPNEIVCDGRVSHDVDKSGRIMPQNESRTDAIPDRFSPLKSTDNSSVIGRRQARLVKKQHQSDHTVVSESVGENSVSNPDTVNNSALPSVEHTNFSEMKDQSRRRKNSREVKADSDTQKHPQTALDAAQDIRSGERLKKTGENRGKILRSEAEHLRGEPASAVSQYLWRTRLHEDENVLVLNKPFGMPVHGGKSGVWDFSVATLLPALCQRVRCEKLLTVHRIDRDTTGALVLAKNSETARHIQQLFKDRAVRKTYWAIVLNRTGQAHSSQYNINIPLVLRKTGGYERMMPSPVVEGSKPPRDACAAITSVEVMARAHDCFLVRVSPETGVRHQVRSHLGLCLDLPLLGDHKYSYWDTVRPQKLPVRVLEALALRQAEVRHIPFHLHARSLSIPDIGLRISVPLPDSFRKSLRRLGITRQK